MRKNKNIVTRFKRVTTGSHWDVAWAWECEFGYHYYHYPFRFYQKGIPLN